MHTRIADLFCGIGGIAEAIHHRSDCLHKDDGSRVGVFDRSHPQVVTAIDIDRSIASLYQQHHGIVPRCSTIESLERIAEGSSEGLDMWWMSPPCQPYTTRGSQRGALDSRSQALTRLIQLIPRELPRLIGLENVPAFAGSQHHQQLKRTLSAAGYQFKEYTVCPTDIGIPMRRKRFYLLAKRGGKPLIDISTAKRQRPLAEFIDDSCWKDDSLTVPPDAVRHYQSALNIIEVGNHDATTACFTSAYGKSPIRSGSYLRCPTRNSVRRFSPNEITTLMGFRDEFFSATNLSQRSQYRLIGNSLAVPVVCELLSVLLAG
ncbi:MAG: DNA cytosine methyltransferase [Rubripirellula sp.]|jgi:site-specific DNA-cytosine methylase